MEREQALQLVSQDVIACRKCSRLVAWREQVAQEKRRAYRDQEYWGKPVPGFGDPQAKVLVVGLAPAAHGGNRTGRAFTGDSSGDFLYQALHRAGFANQPTARGRDDGLELKEMYIAAVCRCAPPGNRPTSQEIANCLPYLAQEVALLPSVQVIVALGKIAFDGTLRLFREQGRQLPKVSFSHNAVYDLGAGLPWLVASYHPSRQNTQTGRLTTAMFAEVWENVLRLLGL